MSKKPLIILFDANSLARKKSGVGYYVDLLIRSLSETGGDEIKLVGHYFNFLGKKNITDLPTGKNIRYVQSRVMPGKILSLCRKLGFQPPYEIFTRTRGDILLFGNYVILPSFFKSKKIAVVHDLGFIDYPQFISTKNLNFLREWVPRTMRNADMVITISGFTKNRIIENFGLPENKLHITPIPPVINPPSPTGSIDRFNIPDKFILFIGTIEPRKNIGALLSAYEQLSDKLKSNYALVLAGGKGWNDQEILEKIEELQSSGLNIIMTGYVSDDERALLFEKTTLYIQPSIYEGFGMPILEAMSYGKPVICSDIEVFHEVAGDSVVYFDKDDTLSLTNAVQYLLEDGAAYKDYADRSKVHLRGLETWDEIARKLLNKFRDLP
ncbi:glycosyltransferase family 4 protein [Candidatus Saccharibacteria bacterium]|nr:glycosyltransferase family 4 protein [Candidatus Saccharibacteria bacterium]